MNIEEIAKYAGVSPAAVRAAIEDHELSGVTRQPRNPGLWMVHRNEVSRWVATLPGGER